LNSRNNKSIEKIHFAYFKERCKELPSGIVDNDGENPDFLIKHDSGVLGIEHTQLFKITKHPNAPQALESFRKQIVDIAQKCCEKDIPPLMVRVWFCFNLVVPKNRTSEIKRIAQLLVEVVKKWHYENPSKPWEILELPEIPTFFHSVSIARSPYPYWVVNEAALQQNFSNFSIERIQSRIDEKNLLYEKYRTKCDECWLLIIGNIFKDSQSFEIPDRIDHRFDSKFERVFYMDASHRKDLRELHINRIKVSLPEGNINR
jgi:hypothetical protein